VILAPPKKQKKSKATSGDKYVRLFKRNKDRYQKYLGNYNRLGKQGSEMKFLYDLKHLAAF
jgi:hypothetical protein